MSNSRRQFASAAVLGCCLYNVATGATLEQIKGLSIQTRIGSSVLTRSSEAVPYAIENNIDEDRIYISTKGNVFDYSRRSGLMSGTIGQGLLVAVPDKATAGRLGLEAWTMMDGKLTRVVQLIQGFRVTTIGIDLAAMTCTVDSHDEPNPATGQVWEPAPTDGHPVEVQRTVRRASCTVNRGNIFGNDQ